MNNNLYPLGSIVKTETGVLIMIAGYGAVDSKTGQVYQYLGIPYPLGVSDDSGFALFNNSDYFELVFKGFQSEESIEVTSSVESIITYLRQKKEN